MMPQRTIELYVPPRQVSETLVRISQVEGVKVNVPTQKLASPDGQKKHGAYSLDFAQLTPILISVTGTTITSLVTLAVAILKHRDEQKKAKSSIENSQSPAPVIRINNNIILLGEFSDAKKLAAYLSESLQDDLD